MAQSFIFGGQTGLSYDQIQKQREIANELLRANMYTPQNVGEGLSAIGRALAAKAIDKRTSRADEANRAASAERRAGAFGSIFGGGAAPYSSPSQPPVVFDPNSPQGVASDAMAALGKSVFTPGDRESFVSAMMPHALRVSEMTGLDPRLVIAQAAQETGWGKSAPNNNFFGIKSHGKGGGANLGTFEYVDGNRVNVNDSFRTYGGMGESAEDYARFLMENPRYKEMLAAGDLQGQLAALGRSGYATDPNYAASVGSIASSIQIPGMAPAQPAAAGGNMSMGNPATIQMIAELLADPYTPPGEKAMLEQAMAMQLQGMDPMRQIEMQRAQLELQQLQQPQTPEQLTERQALAAAGGLQPGTPEYQTYMLTGDMPGGADNPASVQEYQFYAQQAQARGETPMPYEDFVTLEAAAGNPGNAPELGKLSTDFMYDTNPDGTPKRDANGRLVAVPVPGSPAAIEAEQAAAAKGRRELAKSTEADVIITAAQRARKAASNREFGSFGSGLVGWAFPQSDSGEVIRQVNTLKSNGTFSALQQMRENSPTGAALGAASDRDLQLLADKAGALDPNSPNIQRDLDDYERTLLRTLYGPEEGDRVFNETRQGALPPPDGDGWQTINGVKVRVKQ